jgi:Flp pilus assembly protein TadD/predicted aspartyl protease
MFAFSFNFFPQRFAFAARKSSFAFLFFAAFLALSVAPNFAQTETDGTLRKQAAKAMRKGEFAEAEKTWRVLLDREPDNYKYRLALSHSLYKQRFLIESYDEARKVVEAEPKNARAYALIGASLLTAGNFKQAKDAFYTALSLSEEEPLALAGAAMLDFHENRAAWGFARIRHAIQLEPQEPDFVYYLAQVAVRTENYKEAAQAYETFLQIAPNTDVDRRERIQGLISFLRYLGAQNKLFIIEGKRQTAIKMEIVNNRPIITVKLNERDEPLRFVLDSGSAVTVISDTTAKRLGIKEVARGGKARAIGGEGKFNIVYGFLNSLHIGDVKINKVPVYIRKFYHHGEVIDGYIGISLISKFLTTIDYGNQVFSLVRQEKKVNKKSETETVPSSADGLSIPLRITTSGFLSGEVRIDSVPEALNFIIDTGASVSVVSSVTTKYYQLNRFTEPTIMRVFGAAGVTENVTALSLPRLDFGLHSQEKIQAAVLDLQAINESSGFEQSGILGGNFLKNYRLTFDFVTAKIVLEPSLPQKFKNVTDAIVSENIKPGE